MACEYPELEETCANATIECDHCIFNIEATIQDYYEGELNSEDFDPVS